MTGRKTTKSICKLLLSGFAVLVSTLALNAVDYRISAPNGVGDVVALTNALTQLKNSSTQEKWRVGNISLEPGIYDLSGFSMEAGSHLCSPAALTCFIFGLGDTPGETILKGAGEAESCRVLKIGTYNYGETIISNLTITGGYTAGDGGGIYASNGNATYRCCIISNNYAAGMQNYGGGGACRGRAFDCLFADNLVGTSNNRYGGGMWTDGKCGQNARTQGVWRCTFKNNSSVGGGGALYLKGVCEECTFVENQADYGAAIYYYSADFGAEIKKSLFYGNDNNAWGSGSGLYCKNCRAKVTDSVFGGNKATKGGDGIIYDADLTNCTITNNSNSGNILWGCGLDHCLVGWNTVSYRSSSLDYAADGSIRTNVNCLFVGNVTAYGAMSSGKAIANCTYVGNHCENGGNYGCIVKANCVLWNTLLQDNWVSPTRQLDVRSAFLESTAAALNMTNCCFQSSDAGTACSGMKDCICATVRFKTADMPGWDKDVRALAYDIGATSTGPANKGFKEPWLMSLVGETDFLGRPRLMLGGLDIGAYECQSMPGLLLLFR